MLRSDYINSGGKKGLLSPGHGLCKGYLWKAPSVKGRSLHPPHRARASYQPAGLTVHTGACSPWLSSVLLALGFQMMSFSQNPFPSRSQFDVSGTVGGLRLTSSSGHPIPVKNLSQNIEVGAALLAAAGWHLAFLLSSLVWEQMWEQQLKRERPLSASLTLGNTVFSFKPCIYGHSHIFGMWQFS